MRITNHGLNLAISCSLLVAGLALGAETENENKDESFRFFAFGDMPYNSGDEEKMMRLLDAAGKEDFQFFVHVGDVKSGTSFCDDAAIRHAFDILQALPVPVVYTPGDNEWTDCHRESCGQYDPLERLDFLREIFFGDKTALKLNRLNAVHLSERKEFEKYPEIYRFTRNGILFVVLHIVGSNNNRTPERPSTLAEYEERNAANLFFLKQSFQLAEKDNVNGLVLILHANPGLENTVWNETGSWREGSGFRDFLESLYERLENFRKPVLCIHGDSHYFRVDKPLYYKGSGRVFEHFTRAEVFGEHNIHGVAVTVDPKSPQVFSVDPFMYRP